MIIFFKKTLFMFDIRIFTSRWQITKHIHFRIRHSRRWELGRDIEHKTTGRKSFNPAVGVRSWLLSWSFDNSLTITLRCENVSVPIRWLLWNKNGRCSTLVLLELQSSNKFHGFFYRWKETATCLLSDLSVLLFRWMDDTHAMKKFI